MEELGETLLGLCIILKLALAVGKKHRNANQS